MKKMAASFLAAALLLPPVANVAHASVVIQHLGANDPETEGFILDEPGGAEVGPVFGDLDLDAWSIKPRSGTEWGFYVYHLSSAEQQEAATYGWTLSATMRLIDAPPPGGVWLSFWGQTQSMELVFSLDEGGTVTVGDRAMGEYRLEGGGSEYHEFALQFDPISEATSLWIDGIERESNFAIWPGASVPQIGFGGGQGASHSYWNEVTFAIVPEPATVALLAGIAALMLAGGNRWRKQK